VGNAEVSLTGVGNAEVSLTGVGNAEVSFLLLIHSFSFYSSSILLPGHNLDLELQELWFVFFICLTYLISFFFLMSWFT
jgi:hypothetical protein